MQAFELSATSAIVASLKAGSSSIERAAGARLTAKQALQYPNRIQLIRHPWLKHKSFFNHMWELEIGNHNYYDIIPKGVITGHGGKLAGVHSDNPHRHVGPKRQKYLDDLAADRAEYGVEDDTRIRRLNDADFERMTDFVLNSSKRGANPHWLGQIASATTEDDIYVPNITHRLDTKRAIESIGLVWDEANKVEDNWARYTTIPLPHDQHHPGIAVTDYMVSEVLDRYSDDLTAWENAG